MTDFFIQILNMSISACWLILVVLLLRLVLKKAPKWVRVLLWGLVAVRLLCPFSIESPVSLLPQAIGSGELVSEWMDDYIGDVSIIHDNSIYYDAAVAAGRETISDGEGGSYVVTKYDQLGEPSTVENTVIPVLSMVWIVGVVLFLLYTAVSYLLLRKKVATAIKIRDNLYQSEKVESPFVLGILRPRIYLPFCLSEQNLNHVIAHEQAHIKRKDHWWKPLGFLLLTIHWFNPLMWLAYILLCRDIELACDEKVIKELGTEERADYSAALLSCSVSHHMIAACPVAFGEVSVKTRVKSVLSYKKPAFWVILIALILCAVVAVCFLTNPIGSSGEPDLSFLNYENAISLVADRGDVQVIYYPQVTDETESFIKLGNVSGSDLARYLDNCQWREVNAPMDSLSSPGSIEFVIEDDYRITVYDRKEWSLRRYAKVSYGSEMRYYSTVASDYTEAVSLAYFSSDNFNDVNVFLATILEIQDGYYLVESTQSRLEQSSYDRFLVPIKNAYPSPEPGVGDIIEVVYKGQIPAGYPGRIPEECSIRVRFVQENGFLAHVITEEGVAEIRITTQTYSGGCVKADGSDFPVGDEVYIEEFSNFTDLTGATITALDKNGNILYAFSWPEEKYEVNVQETVAGPENDYDTAFSLNFAGNLSLHHGVVITEEMPYWQIVVTNDGPGTIKMEIGGVVYEIKAGNTETICSEESWKPGSYQVSFSTSHPSGMTGNAICKTYSQLP